MKAPSVTVVVPTYNGRAFVSDAIGSIRSADSGVAIRILVVDDASTDDTPTFVRDTFPGVLVHRIARNVGEAVARNTGLARATTDFVTFVDQDDVAFSQHFTTMLRGMGAGFDAVAPASVSFSAADRIDFHSLAQDHGIPSPIGQGRTRRSARSLNLRLRKAVFRTQSSPRARRSYPPADLLHLPEGLATTCCCGISPECADWRRPRCLRSAIGCIPA